MNTIREKFFGKIAADFQVMSKIVIRQINLTRELLENNQDSGLYEEITHHERILDGLEIKMRDEVIHVIVLYSPRATDLRKIISYYDMTNYLERIGDLLMNIAGYSQRMNLQGPIFSKFKDRLTKFLSVSENMTQNAIFAFTCEDNRLAKETIELDNIADALYQEIGKSLQSSCSGVSLDEQQLTDILCISGISYNMERIGDNATNIAEAAVYLMEGKNIRHSNGQNNDSLQTGSKG